MLTIQLAEKRFWDTGVEGHIFLLQEGFETSGLLADVEKYYKDVFLVLQRHKFTGKEGQYFSLTGARDGQLVQFLFFGLGTLDRSSQREVEKLRRVMGNVVHKLKKREISHAVVALPEAELFNLSKATLFRHAALAAGMAAYEFISFKTDKKDTWKGTLLFDVGDVSAAEKAALHETEIIVDALNYVRNLVDMPGNIVHPVYVAEQIVNLARDHGLLYTIIGPQEAKEKGMGGFYAVQEGSQHDGQFVILEYRAPKKSAPTIALVGKGVTFDTGGVSLKPSNYMTGMKYDMAGAAAVIGTLKAISALKPNVNVVGITPLVENMPGHAAARQDDIIRFYNGKTAEIANTDAEGRLILADGLAYAEKEYTPGLIIDVATLTGACEIALGHYYAGLMTHDDSVRELVEKAAQRSGERVWALPLDPDFKKAISSEVADISNTGNRSYGGQSITAGWFLSHFVEKTPWAHIDIAGVASNVPDVSYLGKGATGSPVRLLVDLIMNYQK